MGPKKKSGGKGGGKDDGGLGDKTASVPKSFKISRQLDQEKIDFLSTRINEILSSNTELRQSSSRNEKDTHDIVLYFQREMEMKDDIIGRLNEELVKRETQLKFEVERMKKKFEGDMTEMRNSTDATIEDLSSQLAKALADLNAISQYQEEKDAYEGKMRQLERQCQDQRQEMFDSLDEQERKTLEEKAAIWRDVDEQKAMFREVALKEARDLMGAEAKRIVSENSRMSEELKFHTINSAELTTDKAAMHTALVEARRDVSILADKEIEYARQGLLKAKEIKALRERVEQLEKMQAANTERFKHRAKELKATVSRELEEATLDAAGLRRLLKLKNKELVHMKTLAATILNQRSDTEKFFLESLGEVKDIIRKEKQRTLVETKVVLNRLRSGSGTAGAGGTKRSSVAFPPLNVKGPNLHHLDGRTPSELPMNAMESVNIRDLTWEDKELVLRVLFAKINGAEAQGRGSGMGGGSSMPMPNPVFISGGGGSGVLPPGEVDANVRFTQDHFEIFYDDDEDGGGGEFDDGDVEEDI